MGSEEEKESLAKSKRLRDLLQEFGLQLVAFSPGVLARDGGLQRYGNTYNFTSEVWGFIEPLLIELSKRRKGALRCRK